MDEMASEALAGRLLVATPVLGDPNFRRTVVLVVEHESEQGTLGVVLNRPTKVPVGQVLEPWTELATDPLGGVHRRPGRAEQRARPRPRAGHRRAGGLAPAGGRPPSAVARLGLVDLDAPPGLLAAAIVSLRVYAGYAGGAPASSRRRSRRAPGTCCPPSRPTRSAEPGRLWPAVLRRQGGELLTWPPIRTIPASTRRQP